MKKVYLIDMEIFRSIISINFSVLIKRWKTEISWEFLSSYFRSSCNRKIYYFICVPYIYEIIDWYWLTIILAELLLFTVSERNKNEDKQALRCGFIMKCHSEDRKFILLNAKSRNTVQNQFFCVLSSVEIQCSCNSCEFSELIDFIWMIFSIHHTNNTYWHWWLDFCLF